MPLATSRLERGRNPLKDYDDEFKYADEIEPDLARIMKEVEEGRVVSGTTQTKEEVHRLHEMNADSRKESRFPDQDELKQRRTGRIFHMNEFLSKLREAGVNAWYTNYSGVKAGDMLGLYVGHEGWMLTEKCAEHKWSEPHYVGFVQVPFMQEYEELYFDEFDVPLGPRRRGWRTIGLRLIEHKLITEEKFHKIFGEPSSGLVSRRYRQYLQYLRSKPQ